LLIITGTMGAGKTAVLAEASDILTLRHIAHASIDLDALGGAHLASEVSSDEPMYRNLRSVCENYSSLGLNRLLLARAIESCSELEWCRSAVAASSLVVCRLSAGIETMRQRVGVRETGILRQQFVDRVEKLNIILDRAKVEDFVIANENRSVTEVAREVLLSAGWIAE
jgi:hypothetical protein